MTEDNKRSADDTKLSISSEKDSTRVCNTVTQGSPLSLTSSNSCDSQKNSIQEIKIIYLLIK